ncbi:MAG: MFS transporter, partial [Ilumatobacteraceae bacterium]
LLSPFALPESAVSAAEASVGAAFAVSEQVGDPTLAGEIQKVASISFLEGFQAACITVGVVAILGALLALKFLPARTPASA